MASDQAGHTERRFSQLVVVGSSAGGIEALSTFVATLPTGFPAPIVLAQHLDPKMVSHLGEILAQRSTLPVRTVTDREPLQAGVIFVVPANRHVEISDSEVSLRAAGGTRPTPSIDLLFSSAAKVYGEGLVAVVLTGTGSDGAAGARAVKEAGGTVVIQNPQTASFPAMPQALDPTTVDVVANLERVGPILNDLLAGVHAPTSPDDEPTLRAFLAQLCERSGIDFGSYKTPTIMRRLQRRMAATGAERLVDYARYLQNNPEEYQRLISSFLIKVTEFFRDEDLFAYLRDSVLPELIAEARQRNNTLRLWSAGCATGEEAYSLAILVCEALGDALEQFNIRIFATDLDGDAIAFARRGVYPATAVRNAPRDLLAEYFTEVDGAYEIRKPVRSLVIFGQHDLGERAPFPNVDLALCRNVLIYFTTDLQKRTLQLFAFSLRDRGYLVLGKTETTSPLADYFTLQHPQLKIYQRQGDRVLIPPARIRETVPTPHARLLPAPQCLGGSLGVALARAQREPPRLRLTGERTEHLLQHLSVGVVLVDQRYDIHAINGAARRLLGIHSSAIGEDFVHLTQYVPPAPLRADIDAALRGSPRTTVHEVPAEVTAGEPRFLDIACQPERLDGDDGDHAAALVVVVDVTEHVRRARELEAALAQQRDERRRQAGHLERLAATNRQLVEANQELAMTNAELRSANEEFLVGNEEAQAATEEVETLNEELQATNEELETLNEELQATVEELNTTNDDLQARSGELQTLATSLEAQRRESEHGRARLEAILVGMGDAVLVLEPTGNPVLANAAYEQTFGSASAELAPEDERGRPLPPDEWPRRRAARGEAFTMEFSIQTPGGTRRWFEANGRPFRADGGDQGSVVVIRDITERSLRRLQEQFIAMASHELRTPLTGLSGYLQALLREVRAGSAAGEERTERIHHYAARALEQAQRLNVLTQDLLDVARLQSGKMRFGFEWLDLVPLVGRAAEAAQLTAQGQTIRVDTAGAGDGPLAVRGDPGRLEQVLLNLLSNAIKYAPGTERLDLRLRRAGDTAEIQVQDYGRGITAADLPGIFARFRQVERPDHRGDEGLGLGLFVAHEIMAAHGGTIGVESVEGQGATFRVRLPLLPSDATRSTENGGPRP